MFGLGVECQVIQHVSGELMTNLIADSFGPVLFSRQIATTITCRANNDGRLPLAQLQTEKAAASTR